MMCWYPVHRHRLPDNDWRISVCDGLGFVRNNSTDARIIPGVQKPHCSPCFSQNPSCNGCKPLPFVGPSEETPSMVVTSEPDACTASTVHDLMALPSSRTVQAPQIEVSHPTCVPVRPRMSRR